MSAEVIAHTGLVAPRPKHGGVAGWAPADALAASTSIRVSVAARDELARAAKDEGLSMSAYLDLVAFRLWRDRAIEEYKAAALEAYKDPAFVAEMQEWDDADDGIEFDDDGWPEYNE